jgi:polyketide cyclase/dehydrase/lipid transport protein
MKARVTAQRLIHAPAEVLYHCIADYRDHHRPGGFLPPAFTDFEIEAGGIGAGSRLRWAVEAGGRRRVVTATVTQPEPGRTQVERGSGVETTFTVDPTPDGAWVRFDTVIEEDGLQGILNRLFLGRVLGPIYEDELRRLDAYARAHPPLVAAEPGRRPVRPIRRVI